MVHCQGKDIYSLKHIFKTSGNIGSIIYLSFKMQLKYSYGHLYLVSYFYTFYARLTYFQCISFRKE